MGDFVKVAETKDIQPSKMVAIEVDGEKVCVANVEGKHKKQCLISSLHSYFD
jgi:nitrite reductase/ring-hydroxylating ferredoxin subunit